MKILSVLSAKGGVGKTITARHMAVLAMKAGIATCIVDLDTNESSYKQHQRRLQNGYPDEPRVFKSAITEAAATIKEAMALGYEFAVLDTPPLVNVSSAHIAQAGDFILIPIKTEDMDEIAPTIEMAKKAGKPGAVVFSAVGETQAAGRRLANAHSIVRNHHQFQTMPNVIHHNERIVQAKELGITINELSPKTNSAKEFEGIWEVIGVQIFPDRIKPKPKTKAKAKRKSTAKTAGKAAA